MLEIGNSSSCTGCAACYNICPVQAVTMCSDEEGFLRPLIDTTSCINCGKCEKVCPILYPTITPESIKDAYACYALDENIRQSSSSGGVFTLLAQEVIRRKGVVFGAMFAEDFSVIHSWTDTEDGIKQFQGSKYVQSCIDNTFSECKKFLEDDRWVLFTGTPCQIGGLVKYLNKKYEKLLCVDIICHGVPSPLLWQKYRYEMIQKFKSNIQRTSFRSKKYGWKMYSVLFKFMNNAEYTQKLTKDSYMQLFLNDVCLRNSCYECNFKSIDRHSDITIADFWGIENVYPEMFDDKGTSFVICHTEKGKEFFNILQKIERKAVNINDGIQYNPSMIQSAHRPKERNLFVKFINYCTINELSKKLIKIDMKKRVKSYIYKLLKVFIGDKGIQSIRKLLKNKEKYT